MPRRRFRPPPSRGRPHQYDTNLLRAGVFSATRRGARQPPTLRRRKSRAPYAGRGGVPVEQDSKRQVHPAWIRKARHFPFGCDEAFATDSLPYRNRCDPCGIAVGGRLPLAGFGSSMLSLRLRIAPGSGDRSANSMACVFYSFLSLARRGGGVLSTERKATLGLCGSQAWLANQCSSAAIPAASDGWRNSEGKTPQA